MTEKPGSFHPSLLDQTRWNVTGEESPTGVNAIKSEFPGLFRKPRQLVHPRRVRQIACTYLPQIICKVTLSKSEYTGGKTTVDFGEYSIPVYTLEMMAIEKLRAICQQRLRVRESACPRLLRHSLNCDGPSDQPRLTGQPRRNARSAGRDPCLPGRCGCRSKPRAQRPGPAALPCEAHPCGGAGGLTADPAETEAVGFSGQTLLRH